MKRCFNALVFAVALLLGLSACGSAKQQQPPSTSATTAAPVSIAEGQTLGQGETAFQFVVTKPDGTTKAYTIRTEPSTTTVGAALLSVGLIEGEEGQYGLFVTTVDGITANYEKDQSFWKFLVNGEMAPQGVDQTPLQSGATYEFVYTVGFSD